MVFEEQVVEDWMDNDFNDFLEKEMSQSSIMGIQTDEEANYYVSRIKRNRNLEKMFSEKAKNIVADYKCKVEMWRDKKLNSLTNDSEHCLALLKEYYDKVAKDDTAKIRLPEGNIGFYKTRQSIDFDDEEVLTYLKKMHMDFDMPIDNYIKTTTSLNTKEFRTKGIIDQETGTFSLNGYTIPGINVKLAKNEFAVR